MNADFMFYLFATLSVACGLGVVFNRNTINAALCFLLSLVGLAGLFVLLEAYLLAVLVVFVYAGAVVAMFLFIVMLLDLQGGKRPPFNTATSIASAVAAALIALGLLSFHTHGRLATELPAGPGVGATLKGYAYLSLRLGDGAEARDALVLLRALDPADCVGGALIESVRQRSLAVADGDDDGDGDGEPVTPFATGAAAWARLPGLA